MKKSLYFIIALSTALFLFIFWKASPMLSYAEGWNTFYYNKYFIADEICAGNTASLMEAFVLQFFCKPLHGILVLSCAFLLLEFLLIAILHKSISRFVKTQDGTFAYVLSFIIMVNVALITASSLSKTSIANIIGLGSEDAQKTMQYKQLSNMSRNEDWDGIIDCTQGTPEINLLNQNIINMAMAEKGLLHEHLEDNPCVDINSIYVNDIQSEYIAAMLSDIYYSMGHIAQAQRYAFESIEKMESRSPRLLQRLIKTNIIYGQYAVARKYLDKLSDAVYYKEWCEHYSMLLDDAAVKADKELSQKRLCLNIQNKFSGFNGLDKDLLMVARATKEHKQSLTTVQYLSALYRLAGYKDEYNSLIKEFNLNRR